MLVLGAVAFGYGLFVAEDNELWWVAGGTVGLPDAAELTDDGGQGRGEDGLAQ